MSNPPSSSDHAQDHCRDYPRPIKISPAISHKNNYAYSKEWKVSRRLVERGKIHFGVKGRH
ncbi:hypothetical protein ACLOJK_018886, partial [Asimina triloba]